MALELARSGISVTGIDMSRDMLRVAREKVKAEVSFLSAQTMRDILSSCGVEIKQESGGFVSTPYRPGDERMVVVAKRRV